MSIRVALNHKTEYHFDRLVTLSPHVVRLWPAPHCRTPILSRSIKITPETHFLNWQQDPFSNYLARLVFPEKAKSLTIEIDIVAEMININPFDFFVEEYAEKCPFVYEKALAKELSPYFETVPVEPKMKEFFAKISMEPVRSIDFVVALNQLVNSELKYTIRLEPGMQTPEETLTKKSGSCRDFAWLLVQAFRHVGLAARFVSGYSIQLVADVKALDGPSGTAVDCCDLHAWAEVYLPGAGWVGLDATCGLLAGSGYIPLAATADPSSAAPVTGSLAFDIDPNKKDDKLGEEFKHSMSVTRIHEDIRVTKPYTEEQWTEIEALGHTVDELFDCDDVKLTMGGEPTFVGIDHPDDPEWNTTAVGPRKRTLAGVLLKRLREKFAPGGFLHYGQGKWYPGEQLPRWALGCYWRKDGEPIWTDPSLVADESKNYGYTKDHADTFIKALAKRLKVEPAHAIPGYEDVWHYLLQERRFPVNVDPMDCKLGDPEARKRMAKIFDQGLDKIIGYALPLQRRWMDGVVKWVSGPWFLRREHMFLHPGDSPMGFRLPLESLPWVREEDREMHTELDPFSRYEALPPRVEFQRNEVPAPFRRGAAPDELRSRGWPTQEMFERTMRWPKRGDGKPGKPGTSAAVPVAYNASGEPVSAEELKRLRYDVVRTALCVEPRGGQMYVFLPPQYCLEDYLSLVTAIEDTARELKMPLLVEGYTPPHDPRLEVMKVTPDPGVIEVNIHPAKNWKELVANTTILYEEARQSRLTTEKFLVDGRHTGTGGGNHIVVGAETPGASPLLRRPDVLRSLISFWQNHPSLSYLFSGMFIGPTSQHPRIDEARNDSLFELELAFKQIPDFGNTPPWLVDRVLRNLLIDASGNTHRTEFCIDKLYSPDSSTGRLGLLELRSFEMPPHSRMSLAQQLLMRALIAKFWERPYKHHLVRWGTELHDRFMLPHFCEQDFTDVCEELQEAGINMKPEWFAPHLDFRFPFYGEFTQKGVHFELRQALEPWHVLGEEPGPGGTVRLVDSSVERLQVKVEGMTDSRHIAVCNGRRIPLHPTGTNGEYVAGIRYRAWQPPSCLHPTIPVHAPLVIDLLDTWNGRSIGGCTYHVSHPGGRSFETVPVNAYEAESRRVARYFPHGHTPGPMAIPLCEKTPEFPFTLDMRH